MARIYLKRQKCAADMPAVSRGIQRQLAWAAGSEYFQHRDPVWHVAEAFQTIFDRTGRRKIREREEAQDKPQVPFEQAEADAWKQPSWQSFSETAFQRGNLAGAVLQGTGRVMLTSCLNRAAGQAPRPERARALSGLGAKTKRMPNGGGSQVVFHRGFVHSAVGLVVDVLQDAGRTVDLMSRMVQGEGGLGERDGMQTLRAIYPFLNQGREELLLEQYRQLLRQAHSVQEKALLHGAIVRTEALRDKKAQMREEFTQKLREISGRANQALREFQAPGFVDCLMRDLTEGGANASDSRPLDGKPADCPGAPDGGAGAVPPERPTWTGGGAGLAGSAGGGGSGAASPGAAPADGR